MALRRKENDVFMAQHISELWRDSFRENFMKYYERFECKDSFIAEICGVSRQTVHQWKTGESIPAPDKFYYLTRLFNCRYEDLLDFDPGMYRARMEGTYFKGRLL